MMKSTNKEEKVVSDDTCPKLYEAIPRCKRVVLEDGTIKIEIFPLITYETEVEKDA